MKTIHKNVLHVEGRQDKLLIPELIEANGIDWGTKDDPIVYIRDYDGLNQLIDPVKISARLKASDLSALGLMVDADDSPSDRWRSVRNACIESIPDLPERLPEEGLIHTTSDGIRFGVWMMPDNQNRGMLETFLSYLIPDESEVLWQSAREVTREAKSQGAPFKDSHVDKAYIYTWLAWQNPPGRQLHNAVMKKILNPLHPRGQVFINWFKTLYQL